MFTISNSTTRSWILLIVSITITVLFMVFAEPIFTTFYIGTGSFADAMYDFNLYFTLATYISLVVWLLAVFYYWIIDMVKLSSFLGWLFFCVLAVVVACGVAYFYSFNVFEVENLEFDAYLFSLTTVVIPLALVEYIIVSFGVKDFSANCSTRPF